MSAEPHTLTIRPRQHTLNVDGVCSCHAWHVRNRTRADVREAHAAHVQERLGPSGTERRER